MNSRNRLKRLATLVIVVLIGAGIGYFSYARFIKGGEVEATGQQEVYVVGRSDLSASVSTVGALTMPNKVILRFTLSDGARDVITEMNAKLGDSVEKGQVLATLSPVSAQNTLAQAESNLSAAQQALKDAQKPYSDADMAKQEAAVLNAELALSKAEEDLEAAQNPYEPSDFADAEAAVRNAQLALENAKLKLTATQNSSTVSKDVRDRANERNWYEVDYGNALVDYQNGRISKQELDGHWNNLVTAREKYEMAVQEASMTLVAAQSNVSKAEDSMRDAEKKLADMHKGPDATDIRRNELQVVIAKASLQEQQEALAEMKAGPNPDKVSQAEAKLKSAEAAYEEAKEGVEGTKLIAPFDGLVADVGAKEGESVASTTNIITLLDPSVVQLDGTLDEVDVYQAKVGQEAIITLDAIPSVQLQGKVSSISPTAKVQSGVVTYRVLLSVEPLQQAQAREGAATSQRQLAVGDQLQRDSTAAPRANRRQQSQSAEGSTVDQSQQGRTLQGEATAAPQQPMQLREGLTGIAEIMVMDKKNVLLVPGRAIQRRGQDVFVQVLADGVTSARTVVTGLSTDEDTEILSGLEEGEQIVIPARQSGTVPSAAGQRQTTRRSGGQTQVLPGVSIAMPRR